MPSCRADFEWGPRLGTGAYGSVFRVRRFADGLQYVVKETVDRLVDESTAVYR
ncbi:hypothetical protein EMIHUDRAFT_228312 [Emiliania huxleyi CCMP1516]|uniref:Protein kinase domain-containing protein n=2 Tax=Emiliania huxleyi TaxID=2903 RepID=A0A0D3KG90_EMIH1|nr:hypothetical protein EMIHUDRAFT_228312 [Emiliania huxleyi CCMP1516]EOD34775.1 hypothetical protein EMIHUDRAFT_228312 [Emiliania huxleyi CCMP1516]|eukprot:XP_005787204.1 hypothetical protein EMIHUDRAFT_228312 [Emiliania huxleyi CCMP1516]